jgi:hypothetical protein
MNYLSNAFHRGVDNTGTSLRLLVNRLMSDSLAPAVHTKSFIVNEVPADIRMIADEDKVMPVISELLTTVVANARNGNIHISAERFRDVVILEIQDRNNYNGYALAYSIQSIEPQATMLGGYIRMKGQQELVTTISFSFPIHAA